MNIKKILLVFLSLTFSIGIIIISIFRVCQTEAQAKLALTEKVKEGSYQSTSSGQKGQKIDYYLPYPGILPDHLLYWLKMIRDRVLLILTRQPAAKTARLLLYADKRLGAAKVLIEGGKVQLGITTATKGEKYLEEAVYQFKKLDKQEVETKEKLVKAIQKHQEILTGFLGVLSGQPKEILKQVVEKTKSLNLNN